jgi:hypothetical protein
MFNRAPPPPGQTYYSGVGLVEVADGESAGDLRLFVRLDGVVGVLDEWFVVEEPLDIGFGQAIGSHHHRHLFGVFDLIVGQAGDDRWLFG